MATDGGELDFDSLVSEAASAEGIEGEQRVRPKSGPHPGDPIDVPRTRADEDEPSPLSGEQTKALAAGLDSAIRMLVGAPQREGSTVEFVSDEGQLQFAADFLEPFAEEHLQGLVRHPVGGLVAATVFLLAFALKDAAATSGDEDEGEGVGLPAGFTSGADLDAESGGGESSGGESEGSGERPTGQSPKAEPPTIHAGG